MKNALLSFYFLISLSTCLHAQQSLENPGFLSVTNKYEFNLPQLGVSLPLPANAGFCVPKLIGDSVFLEIGDQTNYYINISYFDNPEMKPFEFTLDNEKSRLTVYTRKKREGEEDMNQRLQKMSDWVKILAPLKTKIVDKTISYRVEVETDSADVHIVPCGDYYFLFSLKSSMDSKDKKKYETLIKNFEQRNLSKEKNMYETRIKSGYFDNKKNEKRNPVPSTEFHKMSGVFENPTSVSWEKLNISIDIPQDWKYEINGRQMMWKDKNDVKVEIEGVDMIDNTFMFNSFSNKDIYIYLRYFTKTDEGVVASSVKNQAKATKYSKSIETTLDGIPVTAVLYGSKYKGTIAVYFNANGIGYWLSAHLVTKEKLPLINQIFASIKIKGDSLNRLDNGKQNKEPFSALEMIDSPVSKELDKTPLALKEINSSMLFELDIPNIETKLGLPGNVNNYVYEINNMQIDVSNNKIEKLPTNENDRLSIYSTKYPLSLLISKGTQITDLGKYTQEIRDSFEDYVGYKILKATVTTINNIEWSVFCYSTNGQYLAMFTTLKDGYQITFTTYCNSEDELHKNASYIQSFRFID